MPIPKSQNLPGLRILVVEDDLLIAMDLEATLEDFGCTVVGPCECLDKALEAAEYDVDAAIVDMNLRGEQSFPVIERLRARRVPTIVCSGYVDLPDVKERLAGIPTLAKPCSPTRLLGLLEDLMQRVGRVPQPAAN